MPLIKREKPERDVSDRNYSRDREGLLAQLDLPNDSERRQAARYLAAHSAVSAELHRHLEVETISSVRSVLFSTLTQIGDREAVVGLIALLRSENAELRNGSIEALQCLPDQLSEHIEELLRDDDADVRIFAINILETLPHPDVPYWLHRVIKEDVAVNVCAAAVDQLAELGTTAMVDDLLALKERFAGTSYIEFAVDLTVELISESTPLEISVKANRL